MAAGRTREVVAAPELVGAGGWINTAEPLSLAALRGKVVLLDFWTFCCINCLHIIEELRPLEAAFPRDLVVIGVHSPKFPEEHDHEAVVRAVARHRITHPVLDDPDMITWQRYGVRAWPTLFLIDTNGHVRGGLSGEGHGDQLRQAIAALVEEGRRTGTLAPEKTVRLAGTAAARGKPRGTGMLAFPGKVASDGGSRLAIADTDHDRVLVVSLAGAIEREFGGLREPQGLYFDATDGERLVVANCLADEVVAIDLAGGERRTLASGISSAWDVTPWHGGIAVAEAGRHRLWLIEDAGKGPARPLAGSTAEGLQDGAALQAELAQPSGLSVAPDGALLFLDSETSSLRRLADGQVSTLIGQGLFEWGKQDGDRETARMQHPLGIAAAPDGAVYIADTFNSRLRVWRDGTLSTLPLEGLDEPGGLCLLPDGRLAVADTNNHRILLVEPATGAAELLPLAAERPAAERELASGAEVLFTLALDLGDDELDPSDGPPVRVSISADPPRLLAPGPRSWALDALPASVGVVTAGEGAGTLVFDVRAASCQGDECRLHSRRAELRVRLAPGGAAGAEA
ncbi:MAG TPA: thioredoxin-like domain-containing protein [Dehalococcoidia bacterium]|nr:thioredoxin-like domain-containing protein [Dehalococcoidia bacterium]